MVRGGYNTGESEMRTLLAAKVEKGESWQLLEVRKGKEEDLPLELLEGNAALLTP